MQGIEEAAANLHSSVGELERCLGGEPDGGAAPLTTEAAAAQAAADSAEPAVELDEAILPRHRKEDVAGTIIAIVALVCSVCLLTKTILRRRSRPSPRL